MTVANLRIENAGLVDIQEGLNIISLSDLGLFQRLIGFMGGGDVPQIVLSVAAQPKLVSKSVLFVGDPVSGVDIRSYYSKYIEKTMHLAFSEDNLAQLYQINNEIITVLDGVIIDNNLPFVIGLEWQVDKLVKSQVISLEKPQFTTIFGKITDIVHVMALMSETRFLVLNNLSLYCTLTEMEELHQHLLAEGVHLIAIDLSNGRNPSDTTFNSIQIDQDFEIW